MSLLKDFKSYCKSLLLGSLYKHANFKNIKKNHCSKVLGIVKNDSSSEQSFPRRYKNVSKETVINNGNYENDHCCQKILQEGRSDRSCVP